MEKNLKKWLKHWYFVWDLLRKRLVLRLFKTFTNFRTCSLDTTREPFWQLETHLTTRVQHIIKISKEVFTRRLVQGSLFIRDHHQFVVNRGGWLGTPWHLGTWHWHHHIASRMGRVQCFSSLCSVSQTVNALIKFKEISILQMIFKASCKHGCFCLISQISSGCNNICTG